jgi:hypothetical protein
MTSSAVEQENTGRRVVTQVESLSALVGAHPDALAAIYRAARATDPADLGESPRGRLLALAKGADVYLALRPFVRALATDMLPWRGKTFDHGGNSGQNVVFGRKAFRFRAEVGPSLLDGKPALVLSYDSPAHGNPWPLRAVVDELRTVAKGVAMGPAMFTGSGAPLTASAAPRLAPTTVLWFGLEASR